ncbi:MAG: hypothetical protein AB1611_21275 [bacterium]
MKAEIQSLIALIKRQEEIIMDIVRQIEERVNLLDKSSDALIFTAYGLHNLYCAIEDIFKEVSRIFENSLAEPERWHRELLVKMTLEVEGIRPRLISEGSFIILDELRAFRHFFRHAYGIPMDNERVKRLVEKAIGLQARLHDDLDSFINKLKKDIATE